MSNAYKILNRVNGVKQTGTDKWIAKCPAHNDSSPSLSIRETDDGRLLIHDFGGCSVEDVLSAVGLTFGDLFDAPLGRHFEPIRGGFNARELLMLIAHESLVVMLIIEDALGNPLDDEQRLRLSQA